MSIITYPLNGIDYDAEDAETYLCTRISGVYASEGHFDATITGDREVTIGTGLAWIRNTDHCGKSVYNDMPVTLTIPLADGAVDRIDRIVLRFSKDDNASEIAVKEGYASNVPEPPDLTRTEYVYELGLYTVRVAASSVTVSAADITDTRMDEEVCGLMRDGVTGIPTQELYDAFYAWYANVQAEAGELYDKFSQETAEAYQAFLERIEKYETEYQEEFEEWFEHVKDILSGDVAGNLELEIEALQARCDALEEAVTEKDIDGMFPPKLYATFADGKLTISADSGDMGWYSDTSDVPWADFAGDIAEVVIEESVRNVRMKSTAYWFYGCSGLTELDLSNLDTSSVTDMAYMFSNCSGLTTLDVSTLDTANVTSMAYMFSNCTGLTELDVTHFDTSSVTSMSRMFYGCTGLTELDVTHFDTSSVTSMSYMFRGCSGLTALDLSTLDTSSVTSMSNMFRGCTGLTTLDVSTLDTANVRNMYCMFYGCSGLKTIYSDDSVFVTTAVLGSSGMFTDCTALVGGNGTKYSSSNVTHTMAHVDTASNPGYFTKK